MIDETGVEKMTSEIDLEERLLKFAKEVIQQTYDMCHRPDDQLSIWLRHYFYNDVLGILSDNDLIEYGNVTEDKKEEDPDFFRDLKIGDFYIRFVDEIREFIPNE